MCFCYHHFNPQFRIGKLLAFISICWYFCVVKSKYYHCVKQFFFCLPSVYSYNYAEHGRNCWHFANSSIGVFFLNVKPIFRDFLPPNQKSSLRKHIFSTASIRRIHLDGGSNKLTNSLWAKYNLFCDFFVTLYKNKCELCDFGLVKQ